MNRILPTLMIALLVFASGCQEDVCDEKVETVTVARTAFQNAPSGSTCLSYETALTDYLNSACEFKNQIDYRAIFEDQLDSLDCAFWVLLDSTCSNGILDNMETGVDCGGFCAPCGTPLPAHCTDGVQSGDETGVDCGGSCAPCGTPGPSGGFEATIDGSLVRFDDDLLFTPEMDTAARVVRGWGGSLSTVPPEQRSISISLGSLPDPAFLPLVFVFAELAVVGPLDARVLYSPSVGGPVTYESGDGSGSVTITTFDLSTGTVEGSFEGWLYDDVLAPTDSVEVTGGSFTVPMQ